MKRPLVLLMVCALCASVPMTALAAASAPIDEGTGIWAMSGKLTISASFPSLLTLTVTLPNVAILGEEFYFISDPSNPYYGFSDDYFIPGPNPGLPYYTENSKGYTVYLSDWASSFADTLATALSTAIYNDFGITDNIYPTVTKASITGTATSKGKMTANMSVIINITDDIGLSGKITITGTLTGVLEQPSSAKRAGVSRTPQALAKTLVERWSRGLIYQKVLPSLLGLPAK